MSQEDILGYSGWLRRKGNSQGLWHKRFLKITGNELVIAKDDGLAHIEAKLTLNPSFIISPVEMTVPPRFQVEYDGNVLLFAAETKEEANRWVMALRTAARVESGFSMDQFKVISVLGRGYYGKVMLVQKIDTQQVYAMKTVHKQRLIEAGKSNTIISERNIMMKADYPFIVKLCFAFQTPTKFYLGLEYAPGGELFYHMDRIGVIQLDDARLYVAEIGLALEYLHSVGVVYRDLKPENILLDADGHIKLTDFGLSKDLSEDGSTITFCGTSEYLAPEVILQQRYSYPIDWWALGILCYEMILGSTPFFDTNKQKMFHNIIHKDPVFPPKLDGRVSGFICKLLTKDPAERPTLADLKSHPFFDGFDWEKVYNKDYRPNFIPKITNILEPNNFDPEFTEEIAADSFVAPTLPGEAGNVPGFSYVESDI